MRLEEDFRTLIYDSKEPIRAKTAFEVLKKTERLSYSYSTFKRFAQDMGFYEKTREDAIRIELPPGLQTQLGYGKV